MMLAAGPSGQSSIGVKAPLSTESGSVDLSALRDEDALFEQNGVISDNGLAFMLDSIDRLGELSARANASSRREANLIRQTTAARARSTRTAGISSARCCGSRAIRR